MHSFVAIMLNGALFVSRLSPLKRVLCMAPVPKAFTEHVGHYDIGFAISDPYLAFASPIDVKYELQLSKDYVYSTLPPTPDALLEQIGYRDVDGVALALPMKQETVQALAFDEDELKIARESMRRILGSYGVDLTCYTKDRLTLDEAHGLANRDPVRWENVRLDKNANEASTHACVALNAFLWEHSDQRYESMYEKYMISRDKPYL